MLDDNVEMTDRRIGYILGMQDALRSTAMDVRRRNTIKEK